MIQDLGDNGADKVMKKVKESLGQTLRDLSVFLQIFPQLTQDDLNRLDFITLSILPATLSDGFDVCSACNKVVVFRNDLNPNFRTFQSLAKSLHADMTQSLKSTNKRCLRQKLQFYGNRVEPSPASLELLKMISSLLVGLASLYFPKTYGSSRSYQGVAEGMLQEVDNSVRNNLEKALFLGPEQILAIKSYNFVVTGFYGTGKTTVLEVALDKIVEDPENFPNPKIIFVTWDKSEELKEMFENKFVAIKNQYPQFDEDDCLEALSLEEVCAKYEVKPMGMSGWAQWFSSFIGQDRKKSNLLNDLCVKLQGLLPDYHEIVRIDRFP